MERQQDGPQGEDDFLERIRRAAARTPREQEAGPNRTTVHAAEAPRTPLAAAPPSVSSGTADALRELEARIAGLEEQVRKLNEDRARVVSDVADAVVVRLDARWARTLGPGDSST